jgi:hypothetical protein
MKTTIYEHTQRSPLHLLLYVPVVFAFLVAWQIRQDAMPSIAVAVAGLLLVLLALSFQTLTITGDEDDLKIRYGPLNLFGTKIAFDDMIEAETGTTSLIDGWGIHFIPFRGWTFNLWGFECVKIRLSRGTVRIGTDDAQNLTKFIHNRLSQ